MTSVFSSIVLPKGGRFLRKPDFLKPRPSDESLSTESKRPLDPDELLNAVAEEEGADLRDLNTALGALVDIFPDVQPDVFREMLLSLSDESRLEVVTEHILRNGAQYIQGRYRKKPKDDKDTPARHDALPKDETFRSEKYKRAVKDTLYLEFKSLSHSSIRAVLAEHNYSYALAHPTLQHLASKSWRATITTFFARKRPATSDPDSHPHVEWLPNTTEPLNLLPYLKRTGCSELDQELYRMYIAPVLARQNQERLDSDEAMANEMNEAEAEEADALFDCECCFTAYPFEQISTCDSHAGHFICFRCIKHAANEALYGQGWARNIDLTKSSLRCLAPSVPECQGCIAPELVRRALCTERDGAMNWQKLQERATSEILIKSQMPLLRCHSCPYAELDEPISLRFRDPMTLTGILVHMPLDPLKSLIALLFIFVYPLHPGLAQSVEEEVCGSPANPRHAAKARVPIVEVRGQILTPVTKHLYNLCDKPSKLQRRAASSGLVQSATSALSSLVAVTSLYAIADIPCATFADKKLEEKDMVTSASTSES
ncbi:hypothetical protein D6D02_05853 [Aureobasidium pullulans]|uniref:RING-type domain-containing protein n=1 Tax=Aureobasidium pullulans TaxID=5580 RepID=A0A4S9ERT7_AURPU|nr:hypothetical protein D6D26_07219 [Aureobasidium pullulans]THW14104.1 hypothetical protein D6D24_05661 [Aureobasidium pullulans]THW66044.1 hypothetical protein D6D20_01573 [Aureobasidium pullulans]THX36433.1 hypothetical protein D6D10_06667 [Aureobasidium pullulans]THY11280.1 hypothetical protein D6D02_05853 [Aureobasidium pullulans]